MTQSGTTEASIRSAIDSVRQARETLQRLRSRLHSESEGAVDGYVEALETAASLTDQLLVLLASQGEGLGAASEVAGESE